MTRPLLAVNGLVVEYPTSHRIVRPLDGFTMHVSRGQLVALLGPSGSGKTTLFSVLSGMIAAASGTVTVGNIDVLALTGRPLEHYRRETIGIVFQRFNLIPSLTARENVAAPLLAARANRRRSLERADQLLYEVGLADRGDHKPSQLSGGEQQRVAVARGLVGDPVLLLADEPTANLGPSDTQSIARLLRGLRDRGHTVIVATHDERLVPVADRVVRMRSDGSSPADYVVDDRSHTPILIIPDQVPHHQAHV